MDDLELVWLFVEKLSAKFRKTQKGYPVNLGLWAFEVAWGGRGHRINLYVENFRIQLVEHSKIYYVWKIFKLISVYEINIQSVNPLTPGMEIFVPPVFKRYENWN